MDNRDGSIPLSKAISAFLESSPQPGGFHTALSRFAVICGRDCPVFTLSGVEAREFVAEVSKAQDKRIRSEALYAFFEFARENGWIRINPASGLVRKKEPKQKKAAPVPARQKVKMSADGRRALEDQIRELTEAKERTKQEVKAAREEGDLKENAGYHDARERLGLLEAQIREAEDLLARAEFVE